MTVVHGRPAAHAAKLKRQRMTHALAMYLIAVACAVIFVVNGGPAALAASGMTSALALVTLIGAAVSGATGRSSWIGSRKADVGAVSERRVAKVLENTGVHTVLHGQMIGAGGDADHIVIGPICAVVETKTGSGHVSVDGDTITAGRRRIPKEPVRQARRQAAAVAKLTGVHTRAVVCIPDMKNPPVRAADGTVVCSLAHLPQVLASLPRDCGDPAAAVDRLRRSAPAPARTR
jgi:hypothetical protein